jgi:hypothetical protein
MAIMPPISAYLLRGKGEKRLQLLRGWATPDNFPRWDMRAGAGIERRGRSQAGGIGDACTGRQQPGRACRGYGAGIAVD